MNSDQPSREQIELRLTALLLGELPDEEAALLRYTMAQDPALQQLHDELQATLGLVREAAKHPANPAAEKNAPQTLKLSAERRQQLLQHFKTSRPPSAAPPLFSLKRIEVPRLIPVLVAVACIALLAAMMLPALSRAKTKAQRGASYGVNSLSGRLDFSRTWSGDNQDRYPMKVSPAQPPSGPVALVADSASEGVPVEVKLAAEPQLAPPPAATPPMQIVLPPSESAPEIAAQGEEPTRAGKGPVYSEQIVGYVNIAGGRPVSVTPATTPNSAMPAAPAPGGIASPTLESAEDQLAYFKGNRPQTVDKLERKKSIENQWTVPAQALDSSAKLNQTVGGTGGGALGGFSTSGAIGQSGTEGAAIALLPTAPIANTALPSPTTTANGILPPYSQNDKLFSVEQSKAQQPKAKPPVLASANQFQSSALQINAISGGAGSRSYRNPTQEAEEKKTPLLGDIPIVGNLFPRSAQPDQGAPAATPAPTTPAASVTTTALGFDFKTGDVKSDVANYSFNTGVAKDAQSLPSIVASASRNLADDNTLLDAERTRELQDRRAKGKDADGAQKHEPYEAAQRDLQQKLRMHQLLHSKLEAEKLDLSLPDNSVVQITDPAQPGRSQNFWQRLTGQVESTARVKVEKDVTDIPGLATTPTVASFDPYFIQTTFEIIQSEAVLGKAVDALNLQSVWASKNGGEKLTKSEAIAQLKQRLDLQPVANTKLIEIGAKSNDPKEAANIANAVAKAYADYRAESRRQSSANGLAVLKNQLGQQSKEIQLAQAEVDRSGKDVAPKQKVTEPAPEPADLPLRKPAPNAPVPQPEVLTRDNNFSTFSLNVSDVSFKFAEASLQNGKLPDTASIRSEEFINAFDYRDPEAAAGLPMAFTSERARYPFAHNRELLRFAVKTAAAGRPAGRALNLVLLLDRSGSMERADRVAIIRESLRVLATQLQPQDTVSVVTFARTARLWADGISGDKAGATLDQVGSITPEGGTNLEEAMRLAYETAHRHYLPNGLNRVVLLTDGAANLGNVEPSALRQKVELQRKQGIALDCFGIGWEDYNDDLLEQLSSHGDGRYAFLNSPEDASKDFATKLAGALQIAAADVKVQVEFNPGRVLSYRQIGYARHQLTKEQFRDNTVAAGEIAAQEAGNALYTIETNPNGEGPIATVHVRYRIPGTTDYREHSWDVAYTGSAPALDHSSPGMRLAATASAFSEWLAASPYAQEVTLDELLKDLRGVPEVYGADDRPKQLETMLREAKSLEGKPNETSGRF